MSLALNSHRMLLVSQHGTHLWASTAPNADDPWQIPTDTEGKTFTAVFSRRYFWAAVTADGGLVTCGQPHRILDFLYKRTLRTEFFEKAAFGGEGVCMAACGSGHALVLTENGSVYAWGQNLQAQLGIPGVKRTTTPLKVVFDDDTAPATQPPMKYVAAGDLYSVAVSRTGEVFTWGHAAWGKLGHLDTDRFCVSFPRAVPQFHAEHPACMAAAGSWHTVVLTATGRVWTCGENQRGELGVGDCDTRVEFVRVGDGSAFGKTEILNIDCSPDLTVALDVGGGLWTWGWNREACLGIASPDKLLTPHRIPAPAALASVYCGEDAIAAVSRFGEVYMWGQGKQYVQRRGGRPEDVPLHLPVALEVPGPVGRVACADADRMLALVMGGHGRLGGASWLRVLPDDLVARIGRACQDWPEGPMGREPAVMQRVGGLV